MASPRDIVESVTAWVSDPLAGLGLAGTLVVVVLGARVTAFKGNLILLAAWCLFVVSVCRLPILATLPLVPRILWTAFVASVGALALYYTLWTDTSLAKLGFFARTSPARYAPSTVADGIKWEHAFVRIDLTITNDSPFELQDIDLVLQTDEPAVGIAQSTAVPGVIFSEATEATTNVEAVAPDGSRHAIPLSLLGTTGGYRLHCPKLPRDRAINVVIALARIRVLEAGHGPAMSPADKRAALRLHYGTAKRPYSLWFGHPDPDRQWVFLPGSTPATVEVEGRFLVADREKRVKESISVTDVFHGAIESLSKRPGG
jgi:hypothetical protein